MNISETQSKVTASHLQRDAYLYVRQSTMRQVIENSESAVRQYDLRGRAVALGWPRERVIVIDVDQGLSGATAADREGFQRLVADVSLKKAGIVLGLECSRLARNNSDWHRLLELCSLTDTLICDEDGLYDPSTINDRLLLGLKGAMSEAELHILRSRLRGGTLSKARRGELRTSLPVGLVYDPLGKVALDPDTAVQGAIRHLFECFERTGSARAVVKEFTARKLSFPQRIRTGPRKGETVWAPLHHDRVLMVLHNPRYAGAFSFGRRQSQYLAGKISRPAAPPRSVDRADPRRPPRIHQLRPVRGQPGAAARQRPSARQRATRRPAARRPRAAAGPRHLRTLRPAHDRPLPPPRRADRPRVPLPERGDQHRDQRPLPDDPRRWRRPRDRARCCWTRSPPSRSRSRSASPQSSTNAPKRPTSCAARTSSAPATRPSSRAAATSPWTPTTGSSPTRSRQTGTRSCALSRKPRTTTNTHARTATDASATSSARR